MPEPPTNRVAGTRFTDIRRFDEIDSTNRYLLDEARAGAAEGVVAVADHQTAGRGRLGRTWTAPPGASLLVSVLLRPSVPVGAAHLVTMAAGIAACEAVFLAAGFAPSLKWPNDLVVGGRKLAGLLAEADLDGGRVRALVVGMGLNVNWDDFPDDIAETATACNVVTGERTERDDLLVRWLERLDQWLDRLAGRDGGAVVLGDYRQRCSTLGQEVRIEQADRVLEGTAVDVTAEGHLVVDSPTGRVEVAVGDVMHLRPA